MSPKVEKGPIKRRQKKLSTKVEKREETQQIRLIEKIVQRIAIGQDLIKVS